jgi:hypothetical protein
VNLVKGIPLGYYDALVRALLILFPHDLPDFPKSPYGWEFVLKKVNASLLRTQDTVDVLKTNVTLAVMDIVSIAVGGSTQDHIRKETYDLALRHIFHYIHTLAPRKVPDPESILVDKAFTRCAVTVGYISQYSNKDIFKYVMQAFEPSKKVSNEELVLCLAVMRYSFSYPPKEQQVLEAADYIKELIVLYDKAKKAAVKNAIIQLLERIVQPHQSETVRRPEETLVWPEIAVLYKKARKWANSDDTKESALHLMTVILVNSRIDFFASNIDAFLNTDLCPKLKVRPYAYRCLLQLLRGKYYQDTLGNYEDAIRGTYVPGRHFSFLTRLPNEQSFGTMSNRLNAISDMMFFRKKYPIPEEFLDISASIVVQIAAHSITLGAKLISQLLDTTRVDHSAESYYIGLRSLRIILDVDSGFQAFAASRVDAEFNMVIRDFPYDITNQISAIYEYMESQIGVNITGSSGQVLDVCTDAKISKIDPDASTASALKILSQSFNSLVVDDSDELSQPTPGSPVRKSKLDMSPGSPTLRRGSLLSSIPNLLAAPSALDLTGIETADDTSYIAETMTGWFDAVGARGKNVQKYSIQSMLFDKSRIKKAKGLKLNAEQKHAISLLQELILIIQFVPSPEFIGGHFFIGGFLAFYRSDIANDVALALINIFKTFPDLRLGIINGFINFLKETKVRDDITMCTNLTVLLKLVQTWVELFDDSQTALVSVEGLYRVSCKVDACMLYLMAHPNGKIRSTCLQIVLDLYKLQKTILPHGTKPGEMPLAYILFTSETLIVKQAIYAFLESSSRGHNLSAKIASSLHPLTLLEVASSSFTGLFQYYHGELVKRFSFCGRAKAVRHLAKYLKLFAPQMIHENPANPNEEYVMFFGSNMIMLMAMAGVPLTSEVEVSHKPKNLEESKSLLFSTFRGLIPYLLTLEKGWEAKSIFRALYFLHRDVIELFISELNQKYAFINLALKKFGITPVW